MIELSEEVKAILLRHYRYDPDTGLLRVIETGKGRNRVGEVVGHAKGDGYVRIHIWKKNYPLHRLAFFYMTGRMPDGHVDHINGNRADNRFSNLRVVGRIGNAQNRRTNSTNRSGFKGVSWHKRVRRWVAKIQWNRREKHLGYFDTASEAHEFYCLAADMLHGQFANYGERAK